ncbi:MAG: thermosome subunit beta [Candidatus Hodarchaeota archaeon]
MSAQLAQIGGTPVLILKEGTARSRGKEAQKSNIMAAKVIGEAIRTSLGPRGMDKMLVDSLGDVTITNDGATILDEIDVQHPAAKMMVEVAKTQDDEVGDGTTSAVVLAGELLKKGEELIEQNIHPTTIVAGYKKAADKAIKVLEEISITVEPDDKKVLRKIAMTSMNSKSIAGAKEHFADISVTALNQIAEDRDGRLYVDIDMVGIVKKQGKSLKETELINGVVIDKEVVHSGMPKRVEKAKIALLDTALEVEKPEFDAQIRISDPTQMKEFLAEEENMLRKMVDKIANSGANVVFCQKGIDDMAQHFLSKKGILSVRRVKKSDMEKLSKATGGVILTTMDDLDRKSLGLCGLVEEVKIGEDKLIYVRECKDPRAVSVVIRGGTELVVDEAERALHDSLCVVRNVMETRKIVAGGGAPEIEIAKRLRSYAGSVGGREQLAIEAFADALEIIPSTLAENAGHDPIDFLVELRAKHEEKEGGLWYGVDVIKGKATDMHRQGVIEPSIVKRQVIRSATESSQMILRIDDVIASKGMSREDMPRGGPPMPGGMPGGMPGMPPY